MYPQVALAVLHDNMDALLSCSDEGEAMTILGRYESRARIGSLRTVLCTPEE